MPDRVVPLTFPAFRTPAGLLPQSALEHTAAYAQQEGQAKQVDQRTDGVWLDIPYAPSRFLGDNAGSLLDVPKKNVFAARYKMTGREMRLSFNIIGTLFGAPSGALQVMLPERMKARKLCDASMFASSPGYSGAGLAQINQGARNLAIYHADFSPWAVGQVQFAGEILIEVEES